MDNTGRGRPASRASQLAIAGLAVLLLSASPALASASGVPAATAEGPAAGPATASTPTDGGHGAAPPPRLELGEVVATTRRANTVRDLDADRAVHLMGSERLQQLQAENLPAAVATLPGVGGQVTNRGAGAPVLRGLIGPQNLILIEGLRFNNSTYRTGPNQYLATIDASAIDRVEVMLGPGGVAYGSDAMGGVIGLQLAPLPRVGQPLRMRLWTQYASVDQTRAVGGQAGWTVGRLSLSGGGAFRDHGILYAGDGTSRFASAADDGQTWASGYRQWGWHARAGLHLGDLWQVQATVMHNTIDGATRTDQLGKGTVRSHGNGDLFSWVEARRETASGLLRALRVALVLHRQQDTVRIANCTLTNKVVGDLGGCAAAGQQVNASMPAVLPASITRHDETADTVTTLGVLATARLSALDDRMSLSLGAESWLDQVRSSARQRKNGTTNAAWAALARGNFSDGSTYQQSGVFGQADWRAWQGQDWAVLVNAGGRVGTVSARAEAVPTFGDIAFSLPVMAASAGAVLQHASGVALYANYSTGLRAPNLQETTVLGDTGKTYEVPNASLDTERIGAAELGVRLGAGGFQALASGFINEIEGFIGSAAVPSSEFAALGITAEKLGCSAPGDVKCKAVTRRVNAGTASIQGAELTLRTPPIAGARLWLQGSWLKGEQTTGSVREPLTRATPAQGALGVRWSGPGGALYIEPWVRGAADQDQINASDRSDLRICENPAQLGTVLPGTSCSGTRGWVTVNVRAGYRWDAAWSGLRGLRLDLDAGNLLDARYRVHGSGLDAPGRGVSATLSASF